MSTEPRLEALSEFLKTQRAKLHPHTVGLPAGSRRRTPGLRREEVAQLAGVSTTWYTWLEQGRDIKVSASVLDAIAGALRLNADERKYLFDLASDSGFHPDWVEEKEPVINPSLHKILQELKYCPTIISDRHCHIVGWNPAAAHVFVDFEQIPKEERNLISLLFAKKELRSLAVNWPDFVRGFLAIFRAYYGQYVADPWYSRFIDRMSRRYPDFQELWNQSEVSAAPEVMIEFRHAKAGKMLFNLTSLQVQGDADLRCSIYTPIEGTATESKLKKLIEGTSKDLY
ncbi:helix-turn-helix transcriptional regulator [Paenibacillus timonensis]|uniref:Helix-turn-helix transcriptional regulator n=1 Tax=Paenibacillus timonensis TaxID=225915 RepID=A0ABW3S8L5_9BACL|nr:MULTISPECIES: helix-turn-helix transcriptional regulator [Paenibacillus]MCH1639274.1 helix-turn-helix transcriptional regulator [Paenibacillus timonensis]MDU2241713.1 helix-turn-helix transcriptional regulator [Paenibacillus sp.]GJM80252.1 transcriptional regulator [Paenibacillus sp. HMSSN-139]